MIHMNQAFHLYRLQQIDTQIDKLRAALTEIERLLAGDEAVLEARQRVEQSVKMLNGARKKLKDAEATVSAQQIKINQSESTLYGGKVRNPKELQDLQKEIASLKKHLQTLEDLQLEAMMAVEEAEQQAQSSQSAFTASEASFAEQSSGWRGQRERFQHQLESLQAERLTAVSQVSQQGLQLYETTRKRKSGVGVTIIRDGSCDVCGTEIRPAQLQAARSAQDFVFCESCGRILYAG